MYVLTHIIVLYVCVCMLMCGRLCLCLRACLRSYVTETVVQTILHCFRNVSFSPAYQSLICSKWECALHIRVPNSYSDLVIYLLGEKKNPGCVWGDCRIEKKLSSFICTTPCICEFESQYWLAFLFVFLSLLRISPKALCVRADNLGNRDQLFQIFTLPPLAYLLSPIPRYPLPLSHPNLTCTLAYMPHAYSYSHPHIQSM